MRRLALIVPLALLLSSCANFSWDKAPKEVAPGEIDVEALVAEYETTAYWRSVRARSDGRANAIGRDMGSIVNVFDRYFLNYSASDPYVNYPSDIGWLEHTGRMGVNLLPLGIFSK
jgi:hypothetical protein